MRQNEHGMDLKPSSQTTTKRPPMFRAVFVLLVLLLMVLFYGAFLPGHTIFSNDGPLATMVSESKRLPDGFTGSWEDLNSIGLRGGGAWPGISSGLRFLLGPVGFAKF